MFTCVMYLRRRKSISKITRTTWINYLALDVLTVFFSCSLSSYFVLQWCCKLSNMLNLYPLPSYFLFILVFSILSYAYIII
jgi:hypothetical protein